MAVRPMAPCTLVLLTYVKPLEEIDRLRPAHVEWIQRAMDEGVMILAGRRTSATGGVLLFRGTADAVAPVANTDPFVIEGAATFELVDFTASLAADAMADLFE
jgi:uncharacterized protein YciI